MDQFVTVLTIVFSLLAALIWAAAIYLLLRQKRDRRVAELLAQKKRQQKTSPATLQQSEEESVWQVAPELGEREPEKPSARQKAPSQPEDEDDWDGHPLAKRGLQTGGRNVENLSPALVEAREKVIGIVALLVSGVGRIIFGDKLVMGEGGHYETHLFLAATIGILWFVGYAIHKPRSFDKPIVFFMLFLALFIMFS